MGKLESFALTIQIVANIFVVIAGLVAVKKYLADIKERNNALEKELKIREKELYQKELKTITKAIDLAGFYKDEILTNSRKLRSIYKKIGIYDILQTINISNMVEFDVIELEEVLSQEQIDQIKKNGEKYHVDTALKDVGIAYNIEECYTYSGKADDIQKTVDTQKADINTNGEEEKELQEVEDYAKLMVSLLNNLEYFSMYFIHKTADESVVYQSLHMTYIEIVRMLYYDIASINKTGERKFFMNTIKLFNIWRKKAEISRKQEIEAMRNLPDVGNVLKDSLYEQ